jgi:ATP-dependent Clp protease ATP-binding subunit ClpA
LRESVRLGHEYIGTEHIALAILTVPEAMSGEILRNLGVTYEGLRDAIAAVQ